MSAYDDAIAYLDAEVHPRCDYEIYSDMRDIVDEMEDENAKLRELVAIGLRCCDFKCDGCKFNKHNACYVGEFEDEARKLGVEVNG